MGVVRRLWRLLVDCILTADLPALRAAVERLGAVVRSDTLADGEAQGRFLMLHQVARGAEQTDAGSNGRCYRTTDSCGTVSGVHIR